MIVADKIVILSLCLNGGNNEDGKCGINALIRAGDR
jgi:hypothetical protein